MAAAAAALSSSKFDDKNLETFCLIWLDANATIKGSRDTEQKLRSIINQMKVFDDIEECEEYIEQKSQKDRFVLIVSGQFGRKIVPSIHKLQQIISIYVFCMDKKANEQWASKFSKVKAVVVDIDELATRISADHKVHKKAEESLPINIFTTNIGGGKSTTGVNGEFVFSQVLIDCLLRLKSNEIDKNELIDCCKNEYQGNPMELKYINEFENDYSSEKVLWWYTRDIFFYKTLNKALRTQNIHMMFLFRSYIFDIHRQLQKHKSQHPLHVYRYQIMSNDELKALQNCIGQFISINSFFSTSIDRKKALSFFNKFSNTNNLENILFEIDADPKIIASKPFANISKFSDFPDELEILFMIGSIFRIESINRNSDKIWIIQMTLCSGNEHDLEEVLIYMRQQLGNGNTNLRTLGKIVWEMGKLDLAELYYTRLLNQMSPDDPLLESLYEDLGKITSQSGQLDKSMDWRKKAIAIKNKNPLSFNSTNNSFGEKIPPSSININTKWKPNGITIAGGNDKGYQLNQLRAPYGIYVDDKNQTIYIADCENHRIVEWKSNAKNGQIVAGGNRQGNQMNQLNNPIDVIVDEKKNFFIVSDRWNRRIIRWSRQNATNGETIISGVDCYGLTMDNNGNLYASDCEKNEVRRWTVGDKNGIVVAGGNGKGNNLNQLNYPTYLFVDENQSVYVSDLKNHRVMKWLKGAEEGIIVAGGQGQGNSLAQFSSPCGVFVDQWENVYVTDCGNDRIMRWSKGYKEGSTIIGENGRGNKPNQLDRPSGLSFDQQGNVYVVDYGNHRVQKFLID